ncbi:helix-turn-helix domain-containing protein [Nocardia sp. NBC_00403]|uniref:helix-turn-helix domain-containing protein n=1 Tax=Nocardia sp. NBC_00403 TaxID=2975990 RepID=UPI002E1A9202
MSETPADEGRFVGRQVRSIRARRGISQQVLADRVGVSRGAIAKYENGERPIDSRRLLYALASALGVRVDDLTGQPGDQTDPSAMAFHATVADIETALWAAGDATPTEPPMSIADLAAAARRASVALIDWDFVVLGPMLAPLLTECYRHTADTTGAQRDRAWNILAGIASDTAIALRVRGYTAQAWTATQVAEQAATNTDDLAAFAAAAFARSQVLLSRPESFCAALNCATRVADELDSHATTLGELETVGMLHLQSALSAAALGENAEGYFDKAAEITARIPHARPGWSILRNPTFGVENVTLWRMSAGMEQREPGRVLELGSALPPATISAPSRRAQYFVELGRAYALQREYPESLNALLRAEHIAPQNVRSMTHVRELVGHMMRTARRGLTTGDLGKLAKRVGAVPT